MTLTPLQRDILAILQARKNQDDAIADLETLVNIFLDTLIDHNVILAAVNQLTKRGYLREESDGWMLTDAGAQYTPPLSIQSRD